MRQWLERRVILSLLLVFSRWELLQPFVCWWKTRGMRSCAQGQGYSRQKHQPPIHWHASTRRKARAISAAAGRRKATMGGEVLFWSLLSQSRGGPYLLLTREGSIGALEVGRMCHHSGVEVQTDWKLANSKPMASPWRKTFYKEFNSCWAALISWPPHSSYKRWWAEFT